MDKEIQYVLDNECPECKLCKRLTKTKRCAIYDAMRHSALTYENRDKFIKAFHCIYYQPKNSQ